MPSQIFKKSIPNLTLFNFLDQVAKKEDDAYVFDVYSFKKALYNKSIYKFIDDIRECYHKSKQFYVDRKQTYTSFVTLLRQICKNNSIPYNAKIIYEKSSYYIVYTIVIVPTDTSS
jgi:hypothetical protein|tara:strand:- start:417 stop:764 length:348 start_codon:yes stop_codon:yes gene_type:complete